MSNKIQVIALEKLKAHPANPNRMSKSDFSKLVRNIKRSGLYEPIVVRPHPKRVGDFQIINGHHRCRALEKLGYGKVDCVLWDVDDNQAEILLATLNRLSGSDKLAKKVALLKGLKKRMEPKELSRLLPQTAKQIERLTLLKRPRMPLEQTDDFAKPMVFFLDGRQQQIVEGALSAANGEKKKGTRAGRRVAGLVKIAKYYVAGTKGNNG